MTMESMEPFESSENFNEDVGLFEAATHPVVLDFSPPPLKSIVIALDGSDRDATVREYANQLAKQSGARVDTLQGGSGSGDILSGVAVQHADLLIVPVPFGQNYQELGSDSLGSVADQLLLKSSCPVLCVRQAQDASSVQASLKSVLIPVAVADELVPQALGWGFQITPKGGRLDLIAVADRQVLSEAGHLMTDSRSPGQLNSNELSRALLRDIGGIVGAAQKRGVAEDRTIHVETRVGKFVPLTLAELHGKPHLIIWCVTREHSSPAFHRAVDLLLASSGAVLMV